MFKNNDNAENPIYRCWINEEKRILSFSQVDGYELKEFDNYSKFQKYYYDKIYWGYRAQ